MPETTVEKYAGADWLAAYKSVTLNPFQVRAANLIGWVWRGIYHIAPEMTRAEWEDDAVSFALYAGRYGGLGTYDDSYLTRLVIAAHDRALRVSVSGASSQYIRVRIWDRQRDGDMYHRHPTIEQAIEAARSDQ